MSYAIKSASVLRSVASAVEAIAYEVEMNSDHIDWGVEAIVEAWHEGWEAHLEAIVVLGQFAMTVFRWAQSQVQEQMGDDSYEVVYEFASDDERDYNVADVETLQDDEEDFSHVDELISELGFTSEPSTEEEEVESAVMDAQEVDRNVLSV